MEARIQEAWDVIRDHSGRPDSDEATESDDPQRLFAEEFFDYFLEHPDSPTGRKAGESAFMMWGNLGAVEEIDTAIPRVSRNSEIWRRILHSIGNAYARHGKRPQYHALLFRLEDELADPGSRSELMLTLASLCNARNQPDEETAYLEEVLALAAHPFDVQRAEGTLYERNSLQVGQPAPDFTAETTDGQAVSLSDFRGKFVLLEFWATWCGPCQPEIPHLEALARDLPGSDLQIIGITQDDDLEVLRSFIEDREMSWPQIQQTSKFEGERLNQDEILRLYNVFGIPRAFLIDPEGMIAAKDFRGDEMEAEVRRRLIDAAKGM